MSLSPEQLTVILDHSLHGFIPKCWATVFYLTPKINGPTKPSILIDNWKIMLDTYRISLAVEEDDTEETLLAKMRREECIYMTRLRGCKERIVKASAWSLAAKPVNGLRIIETFVAGVGVNSLIAPEVHTHLIPTLAYR